MTELLQVNAWTGRGLGASGAPGDGVRRWATWTEDTFPPQPGMAVAKDPPDERDWQDPRVGWGLILADDSAVDASDKARALDADPAVQRLLDARPGSPVFRYSPKLGESYLYRYSLDGARRKQATAGGRVGSRDGELPKYLLIVGSPNEIPWRLQYVLNGTNYVGRLDLPATGLTCYVDALLDDWVAANVSRDDVVTWAADWGQEDITWLMRHAVAEPLRRSYQALDGLSVVALHGEDATRGQLMDVLAAKLPAVVVSTSHGSTMVDLPCPERRARLGQLVDQKGQELSWSFLKDDGAATHGTIWYAHACCSAGSDERTIYADVVEEGSRIREVLDGVAEIGATTAPLPTAMLGNSRPLRAFVGHVEPTFNWTLQDPGNGQVLTSDLSFALCDGLYRARGEPVGLAMARHFAALGNYWGRWGLARRDVNRGVAGARDSALIARLMALDRQSTVILGDPTVTIPAPAP